MSAFGFDRSQLWGSGTSRASELPPLAQAMARLGKLGDRCTPCPCPGARGWDDTAAEASALIEKARGIGEPLRFRLGPSAPEVASKQRKRGVGRLAFALACVVLVGVALS